MHILASFAMLVAVLPATMAFITIEVYNGKDCTGSRDNETRAIRGECRRVNVEAHSGRTHMNSNGDCLVNYYGANCEDGTIVAIQDGASSCGNYWGTVRSVRAASC